MCSFPPFTLRHRHADCSPHERSKKKTTKKKPARPRPRLLTCGARAPVPRASTSAPTERTLSPWYTAAAGVCSNRFALSSAASFFPARRLYMGRTSRGNEQSSLFRTPPMLGTRSRERERVKKTVVDGGKTSDANARATLSSLFPAAATQTHPLCVIMTHMQPRAPPT